MTRTSAKRGGGVYAYIRYVAVGTLEIQNVDHALAPFAAGSDTVIAFGGGADSVAVACMYPEVPLIHMRCGPKPSLVRAMVSRCLPNPYHEVHYNVKELTVPGGNPSWAVVFLGPMLVAADRGIGRAMAGGVLESTCLWNGTKFRNKPGSLSGWYLFFDKIGFSIFSPVAGCSEVITAKIVVAQGLHKDVLYCEAADGLPCGRCAKCFRKLLLFESQGAATPAESWERLRTPSVLGALQKRPVNMGTSLVWAASRSPTLPATFKAALADVSESYLDVVQKVYGKALVWAPADIREDLRRRLTKWAEFMSEEEEAALESWAAPNFK